MRRSAALISIFLLAGCGLLGKPESLAGVFSPPPGWRELRLPFAIAINPVLGAWRANASSDERIVVMRLPVNDERSVIDSIEAGGTHDPSISSRKRITLCRGIDGLELEVHGNGRRLASNTTMTTVIAATRAETLMASYVRKSATVTNPAAIRAIEHLCPRTEPLTSSEAL